jgi:hypothetical protein
MAARVYFDFNPRRGAAVLRQAIRDHREGEVGRQPGVAAQTTVGRTRYGFYEVVRMRSGESQVFSLNLRAIPSVTLAELAMQYFPVSSEQESLSVAAGAD